MEGHLKLRLLSIDATKIPEEILSRSIWVVGPKLINDTEHNWLHLIIKVHIDNIDVLSKNIIF